MVNCLICFSKLIHMENSNTARAKSERSYRLFKRIYDFSMASLIFGIGLSLLAAKWIGFDQVLNVDAEFRAIFGAMCLLYGGFRFFRAFSKGA